jgi:MutS domain V/MutS domain III
VANICLPLYRPAPDFSSAVWSEAGGGAQSLAGLLHHGTGHAICSRVPEQEPQPDPAFVEETSCDRGGPSCHEALEAYRQRLERERAEYSRQEARWSWRRLAAFLACGVTIAVVAFLYGLLPAAVVAVPILVAFRYAVLRHIDWKGKRTTTDRILIVVGELLYDAVEERRPVRGGQRPSDPSDASVVLPTIVDEGRTWPLTDQERDDLDLYAPPIGIFGLLNHTSTSQGARRLRDMLDGPCLSPEHIEQRQAAVRWLDEHDKERIHIMAAALPLRSRSERLDALVKHLRSTVPNFHPAISRWLRIWSVLSGLIFLHSVFQIFQGRYAWINGLVLLLVFNGLIAFFFRPTIDSLKEAVLPLVTLAPALRGLLGVVRCARENLPHETPLDVLREHLDRVVTEGEIPSLCERLAWMSLGGLARSLLNLIVFYDLHVAEAILARFVPSQKILLEGIAAQAEFEALASLACFSAAQSVKCYPSLAGDATLAIEDGRHPLIGPDGATANHVHLTSAKRMWVITGPNAAGKSTYLRMVGVNLLLAQIGSAVCARDMTLSPVRLLTDVRIRDDLAKHESYFLSEVRRLRRMIVDTETDVPLLGLIDEPFRGTNSSERTAAGIALVEHLLACNHLFLLATHEETLAQTAAASDVAENYHFQEHLTDGGIVFDYLLRPGPASTKTAIRILEQENYPPSLLTRARELMEP